MQSPGVIRRVAVVVGFRQLFSPRVDYRRRERIAPRLFTIGGAGVVMNAPRN